MFDKRLKFLGTVYFSEFKFSWDMQSAPLPSENYKDLYRSYLREKNESEITSGSNKELNLWLLSFRNYLSFNNVVVHF